MSASVYMKVTKHQILSGTKKMAFFQHFKLFFCKNLVVMTFYYLKTYGNIKCWLNMVQIITDLKILEHRGGRYDFFCYLT